MSADDDTVPLLPVGMPPRCTRSCDPSEAAGLDAATLLAGSAVEFASIASEPGMLERTVVLDGLSKTFAMTGWRCGFASVPDALVDPLVRFFVNSTSCVPPFVQLAGFAALTGPRDDVEAMMAELGERRRRLAVEG